jgi:hypothetical protein
VRLVGYDGAGHGIDHPEYNRQTLAWFNRWLKPQAPMDPKAGT